MSFEKVHNTMLTNFDKLLCDIQIYVNNKYTMKNCFQLQ